MTNDKPKPILVMVLANCYCCNKYAFLHDSTICVARYNLITHFNTFPRNQAARNRIRFPSSSMMQPKHPSKSFRTQPIARKFIDLLKQITSFPLLEVRGRYIIQKNVWFAFIPFASSAANFNQMHF